MQELSHDAAVPAAVGAVRRREVTWQDPLVGAALARDLSGLEYLQLMGRLRELPEHLVNEKAADLLQLFSRYLASRCTIRWAISGLPVS